MIAVRKVIFSRKVAGACLVIGTIVAWVVVWMQPNEKSVNSDGNRAPVGKLSKRAAIPGIKLKTSRSWSGRRLSAAAFGRSAEVGAGQVKLLAAKLEKAGDIDGLAALLLISMNQEVGEMLKKYPENPQVCRAMAMRAAFPAERMAWAERYWILTDGGEASRLYMAAAELDLGKTNEAFLLVDGLTGGNVEADLSLPLSKQAEIWTMCGESEVEGTLLARDSGVMAQDIDLMGRVALAYLRSAVETGDATAFENSFSKADQIIDNALNSHLVTMSPELEIKVLKTKRRLLESASLAGRQDELIGEIEMVEAELRRITVSEGRVRDSLSRADTKLIDNYYEVRAIEGYRAAALWLTGYGQ